MFLLAPWRPFVLLVLVAIAAAMVWVHFAKERKRLWLDQEIATLVLYWFTGGPLETELTEEKQDPRHRTLVGLGRSAGTTGLLMAEAMRAGHPLSLSLVWRSYTAAWMLGGLAVLIAWCAVQRAVHKWWIRPVANATRQLAGWNGKDQPRRAACRVVRFRRFRAMWGVGLEVKVHPECNVADENLEAIVHAVRVRADVDLGDVEHKWALAGRSGSVRFLPAAKLPDKTPWTDKNGTPNGTVRKMVKATRPAEVWLGQSRDGVQVKYDLSRHPHVLISGPTGGGKSAGARSIAVQLMAQDEECEITNIDNKHLSQLWLRDLPGAHNVHDMPSIARAITDLAQEVRDRVAHADTLPRREVEAYVAGLARRVLIVEEAPTLMAELEQWWRHFDKGPCTPVMDLRMMLNMSRIAGFNVIGLAQRGDAKAMGGGLARENYVLRILVSGYTKKAWEMLVPECDYIPSVESDGWAMVCHGAVSIETRMLYITDDDAEEWVAETRGLTDRGTEQYKRRESPGPIATAVAPGVPERFYVPEDVPIASMQDVSEVPGPDLTDDTTLLTLPEAARKWGIPYDRLKRAATRAKKKGAFIEPVITRPANQGGDQYQEEFLLKFWEGRERSPDNREMYQPLVYFLAPGGASNVKYGDTIKIGRTDNLNQRLDDLALHEDDKMLTLDCRDTQHSKDLETELHERWKAHRVYPNREWFRLEGNLADYLGVKKP